VGNGETVFSSTCDARFFQEGNEIAFLRGRILFRYNPGQLTAASKRCIFAAVGRGAIACAKNTATRPQGQVSPQAPFAALVPS